MSRIVSVAPVLPEHENPQAAVTAELSRMMADAEPGHHAALLERFHGAAGVATRRSILPLEAYRGIRDFDESNAIWMREGTALAARAVQAALAAVGLAAADVDHLWFTTVTGAGAPTIDAHIAPLLGLRRDVTRVPSFGLGCAAGAAGIARVHDHLLGHPRDVAVVLSVELCSLTLQRGDVSVANAIASGLFGDGAAAVVMVGDERAAELGLPGAEVRGARSALYPDSASMLGFDLGGSGFRIVLTAEIGDAIRANFAGDVDAVLADAGLGRDDVDLWIAHPGGPRVLDAFEDSLGLDHDDLEPSRRSLEAVGNLSSASVLHILAGLLEQPAGTRGMLFALGPGVTGEVVLLEWAA
ncbi:type III polyketide synthase [Homoserinibacter sp. YIM 151385]|uniref:type III polyketide synthase n=1 Tax=Homoserinibacter sp. YIM 151385 TaxID=2985506 RepID=UPI0022F0D43D|nr:3-oxoacyl-[acyl-carrier-protein] synthase III C-terminal domain-containing protein [Homoserinibacter sp. YIM 151385]WBU37200.1 type III polyketide synthase [Homoserinibacter sp. YIM 151385]